MRVAVCQMNAGLAEVEANVATASGLLEEAAEQGADLAALPELWAYYGSAARSREVATALPGPVLDQVSRIAKARSMWVLAGSLHEADGGKIYNTSCLLDREGEVVARYRKIHLFDVELEDQPPILESQLFSPGGELVTHETDMARVGLSVCYDLRFPELFRGLMALGAEVMFVPAAFTAVTGEAHWEVLLRARAIENQCFVVAAAQWGPWGPSEDGRRCYGHSMVVDPWGRVLVEAPEEGNGVWVAEMDMTELRRVRTTLPALQHRRLGMIC